MFGWGIGLFAFFVLTILGGIESRLSGWAFSSDDYLGAIIISFFIGLFCQIGLSGTIKKIVGK